MHLPTDPASVRELDDLIQAAEDARLRWLEAVANLENWILLCGKVGAPPRSASRQWASRPEQ